MTLTTRLALFFLGALGVTLVGFSTVLYALADRHLTRQLDDRLAAAARTAAAAAEVEPDGVEWEPAGRPHALAPGGFGEQLYWVVTAADGRVIDRSTQPDADAVLAHAEEALQAGHRNPRRIDRDGHAWHATHLRIEPEVPPAAVGAGKHRALTLTAAVPLDPVRDTLRALAAALAGLNVAVLVVAAFVGRVVVRRALAPIARMADAARAMGADDRDARLPVGPAADELADLSAAFNGLLGRLDEAFARERRFTGEASHQLRTPVAAIIGQVEVALRRDRDPAEYRLMLAKVHAQAERLRRVVDALLFLARSQGDGPPVALEPLDIAVVVRDRLAVFAEHQRVGDLRLDVAEGVWASAHRELLGELFDALLDNALKYSDPGTPVDVRIGRDADCAWVEVEDRGVGIAEADVPHVFQPFFRAAAVRDRGVAGVGLGLAVAARIAAAFGGAVRVSSESGGTRFRLELPSLQNAPGTNSDSAVAAHAIARR